MEIRLRKTLSAPRIRRGGCRANLRAGLRMLLVGLLPLALTSCSQDASSPPVLSVTPTHIQLTPADSAVAFAIRNAGTGSLTWQMTHDAPWLDPSTVGGTTAESSALRLTIDHDSLNHPPQVATLLVASDGGHDSLTVAMWRALASEPPALSLDAADQGHLLIRNVGPLPLRWQVTADVAWLSASPPSGRLEDGDEIDSVLVEVHAGDLIAGNHTANLVVSAGALGCDTITVALRVPHVSGRLFFAGTQIPVTGALVAIGSIRDTTDADGAFALADVPTGMQTIEATRSGFAPVTAELDVSGSGTIWNAWLTTQTHAHTIEGTVRNSRGHGVYPAVGTLLNPDGSESDLTTLTAEDGRYVLPAVPDGTRVVRWEHYYYELLDRSLVVSATSPAHDAELVALPVAPPARYDNEHHIHLERVGCDGVRIVWKPRFEDTVAGYRVERGPGADGPFAEIAAIDGAGVDRYLDSVPSFGQYTYRVRSENIDGLLGEASDPEHDRIALEIWASLNDGTVYGDSLHRFSQVTLYDPQFDRMIMFGGVGCEGGGCGDDFNDTWQFDLADYDWRLLDPGNGPGKRQSHVAIYDALRQRMVVFGGVNRTDEIVYRDTWAYDLSTASGGDWTLLDEGGAGPGYRFDHLGVYSGPDHDRLVVYGGKDRSGEVHNDVWEFNLATNSWQRLLEGHFGEQDPQPLARYGHAGAYDAPRHRLAFYGGQRSSSIIYEDAWALDLATLGWTPLTDGPGLRYGHAATYDPLGDRMIVYGGRAQNDLVYEDLQALLFGAPAAWQELRQDDVPGPGLRYNHSIVYDDAGDRILLFAGIKPHVNPGLRPDTWAYCLQR